MSHGYRQRPRQICPVRPFVLGLTGSIGMGKSTVAAMLRRARLPVFDADAVVRALQGPGGGALPAIEAAFPGTTDMGTTGAAGVDRQKLGRLVFGNAAARRRLEAILHPLVRAEQQRFLGRNRFRRAVVLDVPLLLEGDSWRAVDCVLVVSAPAAVQRRRVLSRPGMTAGKFAAILESQMPDEEKRARADFVLDTGATRWRTRRQLASVLCSLGLAAGPLPGR